MAKVARKLGDLKDRMVFVGGSVLALLIDDPASTPPRHTDDLDLIVEVDSVTRYYDLTEELRKLGFRLDQSDGAPLCRWRIEEIIVDVMPTTPDVLGFSNRWYAATIHAAVEHEIEPGLRIRVATAPYFVATKLEALAGRGNGDYVASHDLEDIVTVVDARATLVGEVTAAPDDVRRYLASQFGTMLKHRAFVDAISGHLPGDDANQARVPLVLDRLKAIAALL